MYDYFFTFVDSNMDCSRAVKSGGIKSKSCNCLLQWHYSLVTVKNVLIRVTLP